MTAYNNPDLTQREIIEQSVTAIETLLATIDQSAAEADTLRSEPVDYLCAQIIGQHISILNGSKFQLQTELTRLKNIIAVWNGEEPTNVTTPTLPTYTS